MTVEFGKYAAFVWPAYGVSLASLVLAAALVWREHTRARKKLRAAEGREDKS